MKSKLKVIIPIIILLIIFLVALFVVNNKSYNIELKKEEFVYELGEEISSDVSFYLKDADATKNINKYTLSSETLRIENNKFLLTDSDFVPVGEYKVKVTYKNNNKEFMIKVLDTVAPEFAASVETIELEEGAETLDLSSYFEATDLSYVTFSVEGEYSLSDAGEYKLNVVAEDEYNNKSSKEFVLKITKKVEEKKVTESKSTSNDNKTVSSKQEQTNTTQSNQSSTTQNTSTSGYRTDIASSYVNQVNSYRKSKGLPELPVTSEAQAEADRRSKELVNYYSHDGSGYGFGEVIGNGSIGSDFITAWKNSPSHNETILRDGNIAIAASVYEYNNRWYAVIVFRMNY